MEHGNKKSISEYQKEIKEFLDQSQEKTKFKKKEQNKKHLVNKNWLGIKFDY